MLLLWLEQNISNINIVLIFQLQAATNIPSLNEEGWK